MRFLPDSAAPRSRAHCETVAYANGTSDRRRGGNSPVRRAPPAATAEQSHALQWIDAALDAKGFAAGLLYGVTASGKTFVYVEAIKRIVREGGRAIVLVPEISLTPQTAQRFEAAFGERVAVLHSALSERERFDAWQACARGEVDVVVGARSAVFAPLDRVGLLIVDEAHDPSYKQEGVPRYHAVAVAQERMKYEGGVLLLGSATPSLESYAAAKRGRIALLELRERATAQPLPDVRIVDLRKEFESGNRGIFSSALVQALGERLERGEKSLLFVNRRGSAGALLCRSCGSSPHCPRCSVALSVHRSEGLLRCHYCDYRTATPRVCPACGLETIRELGIGTERVVEEVRRFFPQARVLRMDSDTTTRVGDHARILGDFEAQGDVLVGTQMVAKGLDYPTVTLAGVVAADLGLYLPDFRAAERSFALIAQVCGRSGRTRRGEAIVQTYAPDSSRHSFCGAARLPGLRRRGAARPSRGGFPARPTACLRRDCRPRSPAGRGCRESVCEPATRCGGCRSVGTSTLPDCSGEQRMALSHRVAQPPSCGATRNRSKADPQGGARRSSDAPRHQYGPVGRVLLFLSRGAALRGLRGGRGAALQRFCEPCLLACRFVRMNDALGRGLVECAFDRRRRAWLGRVGGAFEKRLELALDALVARGALFGLQRPFFEPL